MIAYQYNDNLIFVGETECQRNPLRREEFLIPRNCTNVQPPVFNTSTHYLRFEEDNWKEYEFVKIEKEDPLVEVKALLEDPTRDNIKEAIYRLTRIL
jgi:hypothetical protein